MARLGVRHLRRTMTLPGRRASRKALGDWQTPLELAREVLELTLRISTARPAAVLEPTCGRGTFLVAAAAVLPHAQLVGYDRDAAHVAAARAALADQARERGRVRLRTAEFFATDWRRQIARLPDPLLITGNPPWVTSAGLGALGEQALPTKRARPTALRGLEALTGKSNFDISEWMLLHLLEALAGRAATLAVICKSQVARRVLTAAARAGHALAPGGLWHVDARRSFGVSVDATLFVCHVGGAGRGADPEWPVYASLAAPAPSSRMALVDGALVPDAARFRRTAGLTGTSTPEWRSGLKHDCAAVMELRRPEPDARAWVNGLGEVVALERGLVFPLLKGSDVARAAAIERAVVVPQRALGDDTEVLRERAPRAWAYLDSHREALDARKSAIYRGRAPFAIFGIGPYAFAPWKVVISGLHKRVVLRLVGPRDGLPVMLDDTCYYLPFAREPEARSAWDALRSPLAVDYLEARVFWDAKRPIQKSVLQRLDLAALRAALADGARATSGASGAT